jgi:hypothetical protein
MRLWRALASMGLAVLSSGVLAATPISLQRDGSLQIAGRNLRCGDVRNILDPNLPNLGVSVPDRKLLVLNPTLIAHQPKTVRLFAFHHECGHHHIGASELGADCWAVHRGVEDGWLDKAGLTAVCASFGRGPATMTHPSGARRCHNIDHCFADAATTAHRGGIATASKRPDDTETSAMTAPHLVLAPRLIWQGTVR